MNPLGRACALSQLGPVPPQAAVRQQQMSSVPIRAKADLCAVRPPGAVCGSVDRHRLHGPAVFPLYLKGGQVNRDIASGAASIARSDFMKFTTANLARNSPRYWCAAVRGPSPACGAFPAGPPSFAKRGDTAPAHRSAGAGRRGSSASLSSAG